MRCIIEQLVNDVPNYSSQYGNLNSISYSACNLIGKPLKFPTYGDFCQNFCPRTYGHWWKICPSAQSIIKNTCSCQTSITTEDFIDLSFETPVQPIRIDIYETYNTGSVVRIWGSLHGKSWSLLWMGHALVKPAQSCIFSPPLFKLDHFIKIVRLEFDQSSHFYYVGYDAVILVGITCPTNPPVFHANSLTAMLKNFDLLQMPSSVETVLEGAEYIVSKDLQQSIKLSLDEYRNDDCKRNKKCHEVSDNRQLDALLSTSTSQERLLGGYFSKLPIEVIHHILKQVGIQTLSRLACTCKLLDAFISEPLLYQQLNLKETWWFVNDQTLRWLIPKCCKLKALDLSWCGSYETILSPCFMEFIQESKCDLTTLYLNNCQFVDNYCLYIIANNCSNLQVLSLYGCNNVDQLGFGELKKLSQLTYLDLSRTRIDFRNLHVLLQHLPHLNHLLLNFCDLDLNEIAVAVSTFNPNLISIGGWKCHHLTSRGLAALSNLTFLQELDVGWALSGVITEGLNDLLRKCVHLKKFFLSSLRTIYDQDVALFTLYGSRLEQLDLTGTSFITPDAITKLLRACASLELLDLSYCRQIHYSHVQRWKFLYPKVSIKGGMRHHVLD